MADIVAVAGFLSTNVANYLITKYLFLNIFSFHIELGSCLKACFWATGVCSIGSAMDNIHLLGGKTKATSLCCDLESASLSVIHLRCHRVPHSWGKHILHFSSFFCSYQATWWHRGRGKKGATARTCVGRSKRCMKIKACRQSKNTVHDCAHIISLEPERLPFNNAPCVRKARNPQQKPCDFFFFPFLFFFFSWLLTTCQRNDS